MAGIKIFRIGYFLFKERIMESMEKVLQKHNHKTEALEFQMNKIVSKVRPLETKVKEISGKNGGLN